MSEVVIFSIGAVLFIATTWATLAFGLRRAHELQIADMEDSTVVVEIREDSKYTERHVTQPVAAVAADGR